MSITDLNIYPNIAEQSPPAAQEKTASNPSSSTSRRVASIASDRLSEAAKRERTRIYQEKYRKENKHVMAAYRKAYREAKEERKKRKYREDKATQTYMHETAPLREKKAELEPSPPQRANQKNRIDSQFENSPLNGQLVQSQSSAQDMNGTFDLDKFECDLRFLDDLPLPGTKPL